MKGASGSGKAVAGHLMNLAKLYMNAALISYSSNESSPAGKQIPVSQAHMAMAIPRLKPLLDISTLACSIAEEKASHDPSHIFDDSLHQLSFEDNLLRLSMQDAGSSWRGRAGKWIPSGPLRRHDRATLSSFMR